MSHMIDYVKEHTGIEDGDAAMAFLQEVLRAFAESLTRSEAERLARELPEPASRWLMEVEHGDTCSPDELYRRVQRRAHVEMGIAVEWVPVAVAAMARELSPSTQHWLEGHLGEAWSPLLNVRGRSFLPSKRGPVAREADPPRTLAEGRPGSARPLSESRPRPQPDSVAEDNPYGDTKLSSADHGYSEPLSSSNPRSKHPLSEEPEPE